MEHTSKESIRRRLDPVKTRETILKSAFATFAAKGFEGASIGDIAKAAGVPKSLIQYHFGTKEELWKSCLEGQAAPLLAVVDRFLNSDSIDAGELIAARFWFLKVNPEIRRLHAWSCMTPSPSVDFIRDRRAAVLRKFGGDENNPRFVRFLAAIAATDGWFLFRNFYRIPFGESVFDEQMERQLVEYLVESVKAP